MSMKLRFLTLAFLPVFSAIGSAPQMAERSPAYRVQCSDVLDLHYRYTPEFDQQVTVRPDGRITILGIGEITAAGDTIDQLTGKVADESKSRLKDPQITIIVKEFQKPFVFVGGEVGTPGRVELRGSMSAIEAITIAGGFKNSSKHSQVLLLRKFDSTRAETKLLNLKSLIARQTLEEDIDLHSGDMLYVPTNKITKVERFVKWTNIGMFLNPIK